MKKTFLSFGNEKFKKSRVRIAEEAKSLNIFDNINIQTEEICNEEPYKSVICNITKNKNYEGRGFYWYTWKPYIIYKTLKTLEEGDILFYCDSGMTIFNSQNTLQQFQYLFDTVQNKEKCPSSIITFITTGPPKERLEFMYNIVQVFKYFKVENNDDIIKTQQCQAGISVFLKCDTSMKIVEEWFKLSRTNPEYFCGDDRFCDLKKDKQMPGFRDHRHDQSIWSILCKINNVTICNHNNNPIYQSHRRE